MSNRQGHVSYVNEIHCTIFISNGGNRNQQWGCVALMWKAALSIRHFDMAERYFDVHFQRSKKPFRPSVVLSRLFVCKIQPEVCGSVCECS